MLAPFATLLVNRPFVYLWGSQILSQLGTNVLTYALALLVLEKTGSNMAVGILMLTFGLPVLFFGIAAGVLVDRVSRKKVLFFANFVRFLLIFGFFFSSKSLLPLYLFSFLFSSTTQFFIPAGGSLLPTLVPKKVLLSANSLFTFTLYTTVILGLVGAGPLLEIFGESQVLILVSFLFLLAAFFVALLPRSTPFWHYVLRVVNTLTRKNGNSSAHPFLWACYFTPGWRSQKVVELVEEFKEGLKFVRATPKVFEALSLLTFSQVVVIALLSLAPGFAVSVLRLRVERASIFVGLPAALGIILGALFLGSLKSSLPSRRQLKSGGIFSLGILLIFLGFLGGTFSKIFAPTMVILFFLGVANAAIDVPAQTDLQEGAGIAMRGRVYGILSTLVSAGATFPVLVLGFLADQFGILPVLSTLGAFVILFGLYHRARFM